MSPLSSPASKEGTGRDARRGLTRGHAQIPNVSGALTPEINTDAFAKIIETNLTGTMLCLRAVSGAMAKQEPRSHTGRHGTRSLGRGSIVCLGSLASYVPMIGAMGYSAAKHAVIAMVKTAGTLPLPQSTVWRGPRSLMLRSYRQCQEPHPRQRGVSGMGRHASDRCDCAMVAVLGEVGAPGQFAGTDRNARRGCGLHRIPLQPVRDVHQRYGLSGRCGSILWSGGLLR